MTAIASTVRRFGFALAAAFLAAGMLAALALASPAEAVGPRTDSPNLAGNGAARIAAQAAVRGTTTGTVIGVVEGITGAPLGGACITATGPAGRRPSRLHTVISAPDGEYALRDLRPGGYSVRIGCQRIVSPSGSTALGYAWPGLPAVVTVLPGQTRMLTPARIWQPGTFGLASGPPQARSNSVAASAVSRTGSISGRVTGHGRPLRDICALALPVASESSRPSFAATTSKRGTYLIHGIRPGRYLALFEPESGPARVRSTAYRSSTRS